MVAIAGRALTDNSMTESQFKAGLEQDFSDLGITKRICILNDQLDTTGHADGYISFLDATTALVGDYGFADAYQADVTALQTAFGNTLSVNRLSCYTPANAGTKVGVFDSADGAYINMLVSDTAVYVPQFVKENDDSQQNQQILAADQVAIAAITALTSKKVLSVNTGALAHMGGNVRCMSWQLYLDTPLAQALTSAASTEVNSAAPALYDGCFVNKLVILLVFYAITYSAKFIF